MRKAAYDRSLMSAIIVRSELCNLCRQRWSKLRNHTRKIEVTTLLRRGPRSARCQIVDDDDVGGGEELGDRIMAALTAGPLTGPQLRKLLKKSGGAVSRELETLIEAGRVAQSPGAKSAGATGAPAAVYSLNS